MRIIKIITPNNERISIEISGDENELRDLLSALIGVSPHDIKGIKDKYGNYFTLSFATKNQNINSDFSEIYYLICSSKYSTFLQKSTTSSIQESLNDDRDSVKENLQSEQLNNFTYHKPKSVSKYQKFESISVHNPNNRTKHRISKRPNKSLNVDTHYNTTRNRNEDINKYLSVVKDLAIRKYIDPQIESVLVRLISNHESDLLSLINIHLQGYMDHKLLAENMSKISQRYIYSISPHFAHQTNISTETKIDQPRANPLEEIDKSNLINVIEKLSSSYFKDKEDIEIVKKLIEFDNEYIKDSVSKYQNSLNIDAFMKSLSSIVDKYKSAAKPEKVHESPKNFKTQTTKSQFSPSKGKNLEALALKYESRSSESPGLSSKKLFFDENRIRSICDQLHTEQKVIFRYAISMKIKQVEVLSHYTRVIDQEDIIVKSVKIFCNKFLKDSIINHFSEEEKTKYEELSKVRNEELRNVYRDFNEHKDLAKLKEDIRLLVNRSREDDSNKNNQMVITPDQGTGTNKDDNLDNEEQNINSSFEDEEPDQHDEEGLDSRTLDFIRLIGTQQTISQCQKDELILMLKQGDLSAKQLMEDFYKSNNLLMLKTKIKRLLSGQRPGPKEEQKQEKRVNRKDSIKKVNKGSKPSRAREDMPKKQSEERQETPEAILNHLYENNSIDKEQFKFIQTQLKKKDDMALSIFEIFGINLDEEELVSSIQLFVKNRSKISKHEKTPAIIATGSRDYIEYMKTQKNRVEKEEIKKKQFFVIDMLSKENMLDSESAVLVKDMIENENQILISAFEIFSVTKDHWEFCETISLFTELYKKANEDTEKSAIHQYFPTIGQYGFTSSDIELINSLISQEHEMLMSVLETHKILNDEDELVQSLRMIVEKNRKE